MDTASNALQAPTSTSGKNDPVEGTLTSVTANKKRKSEEEHEPVKKQARRECQVCTESTASSKFPLAPHAGSRVHGRDACRQCWQTYIMSELGKGNFATIACMQCERILVDDDIRKILNTNDWRTFMLKANKIGIEAQEEYVPCPFPDCDWACFMEAGAGNLITCQRCNVKFCTTCKCAAHLDSTCEEYQERRKTIAEEELKSEKALREDSRPCNNCKHHIHKYTGCDHITCSQCRYEFCYTCGASYNGSKGIRGPLNNRAHDSACTWHADNLSRYGKTATGFLPPPRTEAERLALERDIEQRKQVIAELLDKKLPVWWNQHSLWRQEKRLEKPAGERSREQAQGNIIVVDD